MKHAKYGLVLTLFVAGCGSISVPVNGTFESGQVFYGKATASVSDGGTFEAISNDGLYCTGKYDAFTRVPTITMLAECKDGRSATIVATRNKDMTSGSGIITMNDGTVGTFKFGPGN